MCIYYNTLYLLSRKRLELLHQLGGIGAHHLIHLLAVLVKEECRHGTDAEIPGELGELIDVELDEMDIFLEGRDVGSPD